MAKAGKKDAAGKKPASGANRTARGGAAKASVVRRAMSGGGADIAAAAAEVRALREEAAAARAEVRAIREECDRIRSQLAALAAATRGAGQAKDEPEAAPQSPPAASPPETGNRLGLTVAPGVVVAEVLPDTLASEAGILRGDVIETVNGNAVYGGAELRDAIHGLAKGAEVRVRIRRADKPHDLIAVLGEPVEGANGNRLGVSVARGVVVADVLPGGAADAAGIARGDVIEEVDGEEVHGGEHLRSAVLALPPRSEVFLTVTRAGEVRRAAIRLDQL
jgi:S1-C subfamily serine protease